MNTNVASVSKQIKRVIDLQIESLELSKEEEAVLIMGIASYMAIERLRSNDFGKNHFDKILSVVKSEGYKML